MKQLLFTGSGVAIITPFTPQGIDFDKLGELIEFQIEQKSDALIICGTTGETPTMSEEEHMSAIKFAVDKVSKRIPVIAGTGSNNTRHCLNMSIYAQSVGADGLLLVTPYYNKTTQKGLIEHFTYIANNVDLPIVLYNVPSRTALNLLPEACKTLSRIKNIVAIKEASANISQIAEIAALCGDDLHIYSGNDNEIVPTLSLGGKGVISVIANIIPKDTHDIVSLYLSGRTKEAKNLQLKMMDLIKAIFIEVNPIPIKEALNLMGYCVGNCRMPLTTMSEINLKILKDSLIQYGIKV